MPTLEQLLIQLCLANISSELETMETTFSTLEERVLRVDEAATNCSNCKVRSAWIIHRGVRYIAISIYYNHTFVYPRFLCIYMYIQYTEH